MEKLKKVLPKSIRYIFLSVALVITLFPLIYLILASFKSNSEILTSSSIFPKKFIFDNFSQAWKLANFKLYTWNSIYMTFFIIIGSIITSTTLAYVLNRGRFRGKKFIYGMFLSTMFISLGTSSLFPQLQIAKAFGISNSLWGVIIIRVLGINVTQVFVAMSFMKSIPYEIDEAAKIDGCGFFRIYWNIIFPLLKPLIATIGLLSFRAAWNDYMLPMVFTLSNPQKSPLVVGIVSLKNTGEAASSWNMMLAGTTIAIVPMIIVYIFLNRYFIEGLTSGAVKG
ncbi:carbohydrate ABC transporter permease [Clostridium sp. YIM B02505]|uniref:Carbohydrate ABC transporter permease n=1 Tax=Clostridium yunnanense TaxID=2800325 RepID=A0ABS1EKI7_9CLOT|nr:carbohydrate ABC transporter permease [Clostridium yunnanense]MBK1809848.1 carbohydrate ABC transporter permease [Clostridium yunnanense]